MMRRQFPFSVARLARRWRKLLDERLKDLGVTQARWSTMVALHRGGEGLHKGNWHSSCPLRTPPWCGSWITLKHRS